MYRASGPEHPKGGRACETKFRPSERSPSCWSFGMTNQDSATRARRNFDRVNRTDESGYRPSFEGLRGFGNACRYNRITPPPSLPACLCSRLMHGSTRSHHAREPVGPACGPRHLHLRSPAPHRRRHLSHRLRRVPRRDIWLFGCVGVCV